jgi:dTDP-4-amino-4,6-dideoxygalactose transaminase
MSKLQPKIPFNRPFIVGKELYYIAQAVQGGHLAGNGRFSKKCQQWMEETFHARRVLLTHSCTAALEICALLIDIQPGDEVIMPSFTFVSTANAFVLRGGSIKFVDIREDTLNLDETLIEQAITPRTKAVVPVHYAGIACEMDAVMKIASDHDLFVIEDAAQGVNATYNSRYLGTIGHLGAYSFHETKNFISGEGGALIINDDRFMELAEIIREKGTNRSKFFRGEVDKYTWLNLGSSYLPSELVAAFLYAQLEECEQITRQRKKIFNRYLDQLKPLEEKGFIRLPHAPPEVNHNAHLFYMILHEEEQRDALIGFLRKRGIHAVFHYIPLHTSPMGQKFGYGNDDLPITRGIANRLVRLPCYFELTEEEQDHVIHSVFDFYEL